MQLAVRCLLQAARTSTHRQLDGGRPLAAKVRHQRGQGQLLHLPGSGAAQSLQLLPQLPSKVAQLLQRQVLKVKWKREGDGSSTERRVRR